MAKISPLKVLLFLILLLVVAYLCKRGIDGFYAAGDINIIEGSYGLNCNGGNRGNITSRLQQLVNNQADKSSFTMNGASPYQHFNQVFGDPNRGCGKSVNVYYDCGDGIRKEESISGTMNETGTLNLSCPRPPPPAPSASSLPPVMIHENCDATGWSRQLIGPRVFNSNIDYPSDISYIRVPSGVTAVISFSGRSFSIVGPRDFNACGGSGDWYFNDKITTIDITSSSVAPVTCPDMSQYMLKSSCNSCAAPNACVNMAPYMLKAKCLLTDDDPNPPYMLIEDCKCPTCKQCRTS